MSSLHYPQCESKICVTNIKDTRFIIGKPDVRLKKNKTHFELYAS